MHLTSVTLRFLGQYIKTSVTPGVSTFVTSTQTFLLWSSLQKHSHTHTCLVHICSWTKQNSPTVPSLYHNPPLTLIPIILLVSMSLCVNCHFLSVPSPSSSPLPQLHHTGCFAFLKTCFAAWKGTKPRGASKCWGGHRGCLCHSSAHHRPQCGPSWGNQARVILAQTLAHTCCHQNRDDALTPEFLQLLTHRRPNEARANKLPQLLQLQEKLPMLPIARVVLAVSLNQIVDRITTLLFPVCSCD